MDANPSLLSFDDALTLALRHAAAIAPPPTEDVALLECRERVLAAPLTADRDQPPFDRSTRDGFAVRAAELNAGPVSVAGSLRAGEVWTQGPLAAGTAIEIMTGAPVPAGADAVAMVEHVQTLAEGRIALAAGRMVASGENIVPAGSEARQGQVLLRPGQRLDAAEIALAAACGAAKLRVYRRPRVAILATGDELVELEETPLPYQIWNSNSYALAALVEAAGGEAVRMPIAADTRESLDAAIQAAQDCELLLLSGGVSAGKHDLVEPALKAAGAEFFFTGVRMQPGKPVVFGRLPGQYFFGLPGNPVSTQVTFLVFARALVAALGGAGAELPRFAAGVLTDDVRVKRGLTRFLPAVWTARRERPEVTVITTQGSGDLAANARANCYAVLGEDSEMVAAGSSVTILLR
ncbi:MAG: molybdopterin molybdotransferase MoeA [Acidobacteriaceae bacterium]|nr:molybdopterin molybdotransferase MoeA [Acidobacteriaceae bacterium]